MPTFWPPALLKCYFHQGNLIVLHQYSACLKYHAPRSKKSNCVTLKPWAYCFQYSMPMAAVPKVRPTVRFLFIRTYPNWAHSSCHDITEDLAEKMQLKLLGETWVSFTIFGSISPNSAERRKVWHPPAKPTPFSNSHYSGHCHTIYLGRHFFNDKWWLPYTEVALRRKG